MADITITRDRTALFQIAVTQLVDGTAEPVDLDGKTLTFEAKYHHSDTTAVISKETGSGITTSSPSTAGLAVLQIDPTDTISLSVVPESETLIYDLSLQDGPTIDYQLAAGKLTVLGNVAP